MSGVGALGSGPTTYMSTWRSRWLFPLAANGRTADAGCAHVGASTQQPQRERRAARPDGERAGYGSAGRGRGEVLMPPTPVTTPTGRSNTSHPRPVDPTSRHRAERRKKLKKSLQDRAGGRWLRRRRLDEIMQQQAMTVEMAKPPSGRASTRPTVGLPQNLTVPRLCSLPGML